MSSTDYDPFNVLVINSFFFGTDHTQIIGVVHAFFSFVVACPHVHNLSPARPFWLFFGVGCDEIGALGQLGRANLIAYDFWLLHAMLVEDRMAPPSSD